MATNTTNLGLSKPSINDNVADTIPSLANNFQKIDDKIGEVNELLSSNFALKGTTQSIIFNSDGTVQKVQHINSSSVVLREDVFSYSNNLITEVRTLSSGQTLTFKYHLDTLQTEVL